MAAADLKEYSITYTFKKQSNTSSVAMSVPRTSFSLSGDTTIAIGKVTRIIYTHTHTCGKSGTVYDITGKLNITSSKSITSNTVQHKFSGDVFTCVSTFSDPNITPEEAKSWVGIDTTYTKISGSSDAKLHWRASYDYPMTVTIYFLDLNAIATGAAAPTFEKVALEEGNTSVTIGSFVCGYSIPILRVTPVLDYGNFPNITGIVSAKVTIGNIETEYSANVNTSSRSVSFNLGTLPANTSSSTIKANVTVVDLSGKSVNKEITSSIINNYTPPTLIASMRRSKKNFNNQYEFDPQGTLVQLNVSSTAQYSGSSNALTVKFEAGEQVAQGQVQTYTISKTLKSGTGLSYTRNEYGGSVTPTITDTFSASKTYAVRITATDKVSSVYVIGTLQKSTAIFNIEPGGVGIGMMTNGSKENKRFQIAYRTEVTGEAGHSFNIFTASGGHTLTTEAGSSGYGFTTTNINDGTDSTVSTEDQSTRMVFSFVGGVCSLTGVPTAIAATASTADPVTIMKIPARFCPISTVVFASYSNTDVMGEVFIRPSGEVQLYRFRHTATSSSTASYIAIDAGRFFTIHATWICKSAFI